MDLLGIGTSVATSAASAAADAVKEDAKGVLRQLVDPWSKSMGEYLSIDRNYKTFEKLVDCVSKAKRKLADAGVSPKEVPLKTIHPLLQGVVLEEEPDLVDVYSSLLANAGDPRQLALVEPSFPNVLKQLSSREVRFLDQCFKEAEDITKDRTYNLYPNKPPLAIRVRNHDFTGYDLERLFAGAGLSRCPVVNPRTIAQSEGLSAEDIAWDSRQYELCLDIVIRLGLMTKQSEIQDIDIDRLISYLQKRKRSDFTIEQRERYCFTTFGVAFVQACRAPKVEIEATS